MKSAIDILEYIKNEPLNLMESDVIEIETENFYLYAESSFDCDERDAMDVSVNLRTAEVFEDTDSESFYADLYDDDPIGFRAIEKCLETLIKESL